ncbi:MAG: HAD-IA family hydrolase [Flavobacteriaceae bacterium]|nr:HAD-IA family hydrolase [Flavobacteriaceae bacterium]
MNIDYIKRSIKFSKIVSLDLFDTLFYRPYLNPDDVFSHLEIIHDTPGFKHQRILAENNARFISKYEEITLDEIYEHIQIDFLKMKAKELELEFDSILINSEIKNLIDYSISLNKKVIFISDMYLPTDFIKSVLDKHSIENFESLYVSSEQRLTKHTGSLFKKVANDLKSNPKDILHIGDNKKSDIKAAKINGLKTAYYPSFNDQFKIMSRSNKSLYRLFNSFQSDFIQRYLFKQKINSRCNDASTRSHDSYWEDIGLYYGSLISLCFYKIINNNYDPSKDELIFIGRDGYSIKLFFDKLKPEWNSHYIHLPRALAKKCIFPFDLNNKENVHLLYEIFNNNCSNKDIAFRKKFIINNKEKYLSYFKNEKSSYVQYLKHKKININKRMIIVDSATCHFTAQESLLSIAKNDVIGIYFYVRNMTHKSYNYESVYDYSHNKFGYFSEEKFISFIEYILASPESFIVNLDNKNFEPIYKDMTQEEKARIDIKKHMSRGIEKGSISIKSIIGDHIYSINSAFLMKNIQLFINCLGKEDIYFFKKIKVTRDLNHFHYHPLLLSDSSFLKTLLATRKNAKELKMLVHYDVPQLIAMMIRYPISIKSKFKKGFIKIFIFPYSNINFLRLELKISNSMKISLHVGRRPSWTDDQ